MALYLILCSAERFSSEFLRGDLSRGLFLGLSTSQRLSAALFILSFAGIFIRRSRKSARGADENR
ncbi:MAG TPA: prolipoprotein diacylglyceryl transferase [Firmicutes bacterium]|nr:prolipoprotein diacylglyceryl transferase [Bacillota bacterium]